jgi:hypothetical protein
MTGALLLRSGQPQFLADGITDQHAGGRNGNSSRYRQASNREYNNCQKATESTHESADPATQPRSLAF